MGVLTDWQRQVAAAQEAAGANGPAAPVAPVEIPGASTQQPQIMGLPLGAPSPRTPDSVISPPSASTQQPQIIGAPMGVQSPRTPDSAFEVPAAGPATLPPLADATAIRDAAYPVSPGAVVPVSPATPNGPVSAYARTLGAGGTAAPVATRAAPAATNVEDPAITGAGIVGNAVREGATRGVPTIFSALKDAFMNAIQPHVDPVFRLAESLAGVQPGGFAPGRTGAPATQTPTASTPVSPVGERYVSLRPPDAAPVASPVSDQQQRINQSLVASGATPADVARASPATPQNPGSVVTRVGPDGKRTIIGAGDPLAVAPPSVASAAPAAPVGQQAQAPSVVEALYALLAQEDQRLSDQPRYVGGVGRNFAMSAADAAAANAAVERTGADRRSKVLDFITGQGNTDVSRTNASSTATKTAADVTESGARTEKDLAQVEETKAKTKSLVTQEAERKQLATLEAQLIEETDPKKRKTIAAKLAVLKGKQPEKFQIVTHESVDPSTGQVVKTPYIVNEDKTVQPVVPQNTGPAGMVYIGKTPDGKKRVFQDSKGAKHVEE